MKKKAWVAGTVALAITIGGGLWAGQYASAASDTATNAAQSQAQSQKMFGGKMGKRGGGFFGGQAESVASALGITADELQEAMKSGKTLAALAAEKGVDVQVIIDLQVKAMTEMLDQQLAAGKLTQEQYDERKAQMTDSVTKIVNGEQPAKPEAGERSGRAGHGGKGLMKSEELATALGVTADELAEAVKSGKTLAAIAAEKGVDTQVVIDLLVKGRTEKLDEQLAAGKLTQEQYDEFKAQLTDSVTKMVNGESTGAGFGFGGGMGHHGGKGLMKSEELAAALGVTADELAEAVKSGKTLAAIAAEKGVDTQVIIDLLVKERTVKLDGQLAAGKLTQEQYDEFKAQLTESVTKQVNGEETAKGGKGFPGRGFKGDRGPRGTVEQTTSETAETAETY
ncbi:SHOCT domain-containing protein [Paenibacillus turpanensis]|uniref:SHOCT domain-containing protein n=1 Tax=Paenibacillus turpanensis TaxID=2689078 RepID=UPI00140DFE31|nr:SHOCT domain-containing protein [Paenibacillus turpanensis]